MTFDQLEVMEAIVEKGSFKAAAKHLHRTQPTLSVAIKKLEAEFNLTIFSRDEYRPKLTAEGQLFYEWAKQCLQSFRKLEVVGKELGLHKVEPSLMVIIDPVASFEAIESLFDECLRSMRLSELTLRSEILDMGTKLLKSGEADFAVAQQPYDEEGIESIPIERVEMLPVIAKNLTGDLKTPLDINWLRERPQIVVTSLNEDENHSDHHSVGILSGARRCFVTDHSLKRRLILGGFGWGRLARHEIEHELKNGSIIPILDDQIPSFALDLHVMRSTTNPMGPIARTVWARLKEAAHKNMAGS